MKWPEWLILIRHDTSAYNVLKEKKKRDPIYRKFLKAYENNPREEITRELARQVLVTLALSTGDAATELVDSTAEKACVVGEKLRERYGDKVPDIIFTSPYKRTILTLEGLKRGWPELEEVKCYEEERIREQEHGLALLYNDWRIMHVLHPEQHALRQIEGAYWYRYPQGESVPDVRRRNRSWINTVVRDFHDKRVLAVTHHLNILSVMANLERWSADKFIQTDERNKPINCGVTTYTGVANEGRHGHLRLSSYNEQLY